MNVVIVSYTHLDSNSGLHINSIANLLVDKGIECIVCVPDSKDTVFNLGKPAYSLLTFDEAERKGVRFSYPDRQTVIHAWTPREIVRNFVSRLSGKYGWKFIVHLEDNEEAIVSQDLGIPASALSTLPEHFLDQMIAPTRSHPKRFREFISQSSGVTALIDRLLEFKPASLPGQVFWPGYELDKKWDLPTNNTYRQKLGIADNETVILYPGNVHGSNRDEIFSLYLAVGLLARKHIRIRLVRTGTDYCELFDKTLDMLNNTCIQLGVVPRKELPRIFSLSDILVQPGGSNAFNDYRFPSKIPEFFASGRPVLLPATNIGRFLTNNEQCIMLYSGNAIEIAEKLELLIQNPDLQRSVGKSGRLFAEHRLNWNVAVNIIHDFYKQILYTQAGLA